MISTNLWKKLKVIRLVLGLSAQQLADLMGMTRQNLSNIEAGKSQLSYTQVIALLAIIERRIHKNTFELNEIEKLLELSEISGLSSNHTLLDIWFYLSGLKFKPDETIFDESREEFFMKYIVNIIDTNQLIDDADVIIELMKDEKNRIYVPIAVKKELDKILERALGDEGLLNRIIYAKKFLVKYKKKIFFWQSKTFGDPTIQQLVLEQMSYQAVESINVFTKDEALSLDCENFNNSRSIKHSCKIQALYFKNGKIFPTLGKMKYPYTLDNFEAVAWRNGVVIPEFNKFDSLAEEDAPVLAPNGGKTTKYWLWYAQKGDVFRVYKKIRVYEKQTLTADVLSYDNCNVYARLVAYRTSDDAILASDYIELGDCRWKKLTLNITGGMYDFANAEFFVNQTSTPDARGWCGSDGFIANFQIKEQ
ncbi:MAG: helix-turn-helix domain-containing protein [Oscillospiraceae bacterium]|nr:helix-turn-helix domain-containing protein [Oscillospiraceae bacterium]